MKTVNFSSILSRKDAATLLSVSECTLDRLAKAGRIPRVRVSVRRVGFRREALENYLTQQTIGLLTGIEGAR